MTTEMKSSSGNTLLSKKSVLASLLVVGLSYSIFQLVDRGEPLYHIIPNILFFSPWYDHAHKFYRDPATVLPEKRDHVRITEIQAEDYSYELMNKVTEGFRKPVLIKGLFTNTTAGMNWGKSGYLQNKLGDMKIAVHTNLKTGGVNTNHDDIEILPGGPVVEDIMTNKQSKSRFIFPQLAFGEFNKTDPLLLAAKAEELIQDLELERIRKGWGKKGHTNYIGQQMFIGRGLDDKDAYQGIGWHTEPGNNWFIQVVGMKRWYLVEPKNSALMLPTKRTGRLVITSDIDYMTELHDRLPVLYGDVGPGDMIFNPEWYWHKTKLYPGPTISVPMRELYLLRNFKNSPFYMSQLALCLPFEMKTASFIGRFLKKMTRMS